MDFLQKFDKERLGIVQHAKQTPHKAALIMGDRVITYRELERRTNALANGLLQLGIKPGDRVSILMYNSPEIMICWSAAGKITATPIALNYRFKEDEIAYIVNDSLSSALLYGAEFEDVVASAASKFASSSLIYICSGCKPSSSVVDLSNLMEEAADTPPEVNSEVMGVASSLIYTSGTTGRPKGVFRQSSNRLNTLMGYAYSFESTYDDVHLVAGPLYHAAPYAWAAFSLLLGNTVIIMPRFDEEEFLRLIEKYQVTTTWVVPTMLNRIINLPDKVKNQYNTSSLRVMTVGGESFPFPLKQKSIDLFGEGKIFEFFGGSEISCVTFLRPEDQRRKPGSCGKPAMGSDIKLLDENKNEVPVGEVGVMYIKSPFLLDEYYKNPKATQESYHGEYFTVGDMARVDEEGYYYIVDRAVDMVISGGVNIYPAEIEEVLYNHPDIFDAAIIGAPDPDWGEKVIAYIVPKEGTSLSSEAVQDYVSQRIASYKKPREVIFTDELPYSPSGKQLKRILRDQYEKRSKGA
ncbi:MAG: class I adenylate-forming enzyme family protein [Desulfobacteraceae bacterium]